MGDLASLSTPLNENRHELACRLSTYSRRQSKVVWLAQQRVVLRSEEWALGGVRARWLCEQYLGQRLYAVLFVIPSYSNSSSDIQGRGVKYGWKQVGMVDGGVTGLQRCMNRAEQK